MNKPNTISFESVVDSLSGVRLPQEMTGRLSIPIPAPVALLLDAAPEFMEIERIECTPELWSNGRSDFVRWMAQIPRVDITDFHEKGTERCRKYERLTRRAELLIEQLFAGLPDCSADRFIGLTRMAKNWTDDVRKLQKQETG